MKIINYIDKTFSNLLVLNQKRENNRTYLYCKCIYCNNKKWYRQDHICNSNKKFCCQSEDTKFKRENRTGETINNINILEQTENKRGSSYLYKCKCFCGNVFYSTYVNLATGRVKSCGCLKIFRPANLKKAHKKNKESFFKDNTNLKLISSKTLFSNNKSGTKGVFYSKTERKMDCISHISRCTL